MNKEDVINNIEHKSYIYISSSIRNLDYYYNKLLEKKEKAYLFDDVYLDYENLDETKNMIYDLLKSKKNKKIFMHFNLALNLYLEDIKTFEIKKNKNINKDKLIKFLEQNYNYSYIIQKKGDYSIKRDIIEVYPIIQENPIRINLFDDEVESIKYFDVETQKSIEKIDKIEIYSKPNQNIDYFTDFLKKTNNNIPIYIENIEYVNPIGETNFEKLKNASSHLEVRVNKDVNYSYKKMYQKANKTLKLDEDIKEGDYVIHLNYGIGIYSGIEIINGREYIHLKYADQDKLFIPIENLNKLEKYYNQNEPTIYKLGTKKFKTKLKNLKKRVDDFVEDLIEIQSVRNSKTGTIYKTDSDMQKSFEDEFEFILTADQQKAVNDIKQDMESSKVMDRLVLADAGYGKTEVAMRAIFKAVENGYQVAFVTPTTVLANQQYERFLERFKNYPVRIESLSRLKTLSEIKRTKENIENGTVDIVIGTHSLLQESLKFKNLGMYVIDEEQKFGVAQKEMIKKKKNEVDVLSITATPIPRTLNMTMLGLRDITLIETAPMNRLPIETEMVEYDKDFIRTKILKEVARDGQVFYITNNVANMEDKVAELKSILPSSVVIDFIHGKLPNKIIKDKLHRFENNEFEVLVASTIIENGVDIPNANTIIIEGFDGFGLSQLYQLRGRVGRSNRKGYCYLIKREYQTSKGRKKIKQIDENDQLLAKGITLSLEDLKIRGAGELLGSKQHGIIEDFGYDIYIKLLNEAIKSRNNPHLLKEVEINLVDKGSIEEEYIQSPIRLYIYKRLLNLYNISELYAMKDEIIDRFGKMPSQTLKFIEYIKLRIYALNNNISSIFEKENLYVLGIFHDIKQENINIEMSKTDLRKRMDEYEKNNNNIFNASIFS